MYSKKITAIILSTMILASTGALRSVKVEAQTIDEIYANAYTATEAAMQAKTQLSINAAREAIGQIPVNFDWAIGEFSKQVDTIQQPIFVKAYDAVVIAQNAPTEENINLAKAAIDPDMPAYYKGSYSSAVDVIQQQIMKSAVDAYNKAVQSNLQADIDAANAIFNDIKTSTNPSIVQWVDLVQAVPMVVPSTITSSLATQATVGVEESFGVTTVANSDANKLVKVKISVAPEQVSNVALMYYETQGTSAGQYLPLTFDATGVAMYGPSTGFPLSDLTSQFKVTFNAAGSYTYKLEVLDLDGNVLSSTNPTVIVN